MHEFHEYEGRRWPVLLTYLVIAFVFSVGVVFLGRTIYRSVTHDSIKPHIPAQAHHISQKHPAKQPPASTTPATSPAQVSNTGPGNVAAIFAVSSLVAGSAHYVFKRRRGA